MIVSPRMTPEQLQDWILQKLGAPQFRVELTQHDLETCIADACRWFVAKRGVYKDFRFQVVEGVQELTLPDDVDKVVNVIWPESSNGAVQSYAAAAGTWALSDSPGIPMGQMPQPGMGLSGIYQAEQYVQMARRITSSEPEYEQISRRILRTQVPLGITGTAVVRYKSENLDFADLLVRDLDLIYRYALAGAKEKLGRVRSRFDSVPSSAGGTGQDGSTLTGEAQTEKEALEEEIHLSASPSAVLIL